MTSPHAPLELLLFSSDPERAREAEDAGVDGIIIDWETRGKSSRQHGYSTEINTDSLADLAGVRKAVAIPIVVRINGFGEDVAGELDRALGAGADAIMLPMATSAAEVATFSQLLDSRARSIIQVETQELVADLEALNEVPWDAAYVGLNDLMISRGSDWIWEPLSDGTLDEIYGQLRPRPVGFGGVTVIGEGRPLPFVHLMREMARLGCRLSFLRRSFRHDVLDRDVASEVAALRALWTATQDRGPRAVAHDHDELLRMLQGMHVSARTIPRGGPA